MKAAKAKVKALKGRIADINAKRDLRAHYAKTQEDFTVKAFAPPRAWCAKVYKVIWGN